MARQANAFAATQPASVPSDLRMSSAQRQRVPFGVQPIEEDLDALADLRLAGSSSPATRRLLECSMTKVLFQWVDGGILRQFQLEKNTWQYRTLMAVVNEVKQSLEENADATAQTTSASNELHGQQADSSSPPPAASPLPASVSPTSETAVASRAPRKQQARSEPPPKVRKPAEKTADNRQWSFCDNCKTNGKNQYIYGVRFKCAVCKNFDLCEECEASGVHRHHVMLRIGVIVQHEVGWTSRALKPLHGELKRFCEKLTPASMNPSEGNQDKNVCNECNIQLTGARLKCTVCDDFDLCSACDKKGVHDHHVLMRFSEPVQNVGVWKDMPGSSGLRAQLTAFHDRVIVVKGKPIVGSFDADVAIASAKAAKDSRSKKVPSKTPSRNRRPRGSKRAASLAAGTPGTTPRKSARTSGSQASGPCAVIDSSDSTGALAGGRNSALPSHDVRCSAASALGEWQQPLKNEEPAESQTEANQAAAACSPPSGPVKTETSEDMDNECREP